MYVTKRWGELKEMLYMSLLAGNAVHLKIMDAQWKFTITENGKVIYLVL